MSCAEVPATGREEVLAMFRQYGSLVDKETDEIKWTDFCRVLELLDPAYYTGKVLAVLGRQVGGGQEKAEPCNCCRLEALIDHIFGAGEAAAEPDAPQEWVPALHVRKFTGDIVVSLSREEASGLTVAKLKAQAAKEMKRRSPEVSLIAGTRKLEDAELVEDLLVAEGVLELLIAVQQMPQYDPEQPSIGQLDALKWLLTSPEDEEKMQACRKFRQLVSVENAPPIDRVIELGIVPRMMELCRERDNPQLQFEAAWALTNVASGTHEQTQAVVENGGVQVFVELLASPNADVREQAVWGLGNISGDSPAFRDIAHRNGAVQPIVDMWSADGVTLAAKRNIVWTVSNLCRGKPSPSLDAVAPMMPLLVQAIDSDDNDVLTDACWALSYVCDGPNERIQMILDQGDHLLHRLIELLLHPEAQVLTPVVRTIGNIVTGDDQQTQQVIAGGPFPAFLALMRHTKRGIRKETTWAISNITAGTKAQIQAVLDAGLLEALVEALQVGEFDIRKEAVWAISNATTGGSDEHVAQVALAEGCAAGLVEAARHPEARVAHCALQGIENIIKAGARQRKAEGLSENRLLQPLLAAGLPEAAEEVQAAADGAVHKAAASVLQLLLDDEDEEEKAQKKEEAAPAEAAQLEAEQELGAPEEAVQLEAPLEEAAPEAAQEEAELAQEEAAKDPVV